MWWSINKQLFGSKKLEQKWKNVRTSGSEKPHCPSYWNQCLWSFLFRSFSRSEKKHFCQLRDLVSYWFVKSTTTSDCTLMAWRRPVAEFSTIYTMDGIDRCCAARCTHTHTHTHPHTYRRLFERNRNEWTRYPKWRVAHTHKHTNTRTQKAHIQWVWDAHMSSRWKGICHGIFPRRGANVLYNQCVCGFYLFYPHRHFCHAHIRNGEIHI